jgi:hypothetical protein
MKWERRWKKAVMAYFKALSQHLHNDNDENHKKLRTESTASKL